MLWAELTCAKIANHSMEELSSFIHHHAAEGAMVIDMNKFRS